MHHRDLAPLDGAPAGWDATVVRATPTELHRVDPFDSATEGADLGRRVWWCQPTSAAMVLGSRQSTDMVLDPSMPVVRRRSGGGAVMVGGDDSIWVDVLIGRDDPLWRDDISTSFDWLGEVWAEVVRGFGLPVDVHHGPLMCGRFGSLVCFAGRGPGEVLTPDGAKVVGLSQRRNRHGARLQCLVLLDWDPTPYGAAFFSASDRDAALAELGPLATGINSSQEVVADANDLIAAFLAALPR